MLKKLTFKPGINRENTRYATEGGWYESEKVRFNNGVPEKIGGWQAVSSDTFLGTCRTLFPWMTLTSRQYLGVGTHLKYYICYGGTYFDITPIRSAVSLTNPFTTTNGSAIVTVDDIAHGAFDNDYVTFSGATPVGGLTLNGNYQITVVGDDSYTITASSTASSGASGGGVAVSASYEVNTGYSIEAAVLGWGAGGWGGGVWGTGEQTESNVRIWNAQSFGEDLIFGPRGGELYTWDASVGTSTRGTALTAAGGASDVPVLHNLLLVSDVSRFVFVFGTNELGTSTMDPLLIRWSDQESMVDWTPAATNQAGSLRLSHGSEIVARLQARQEILTWTDTSLYSLQFVGPASGVWGHNLLADNISIVNDRSVATAGNVIFWMGKKKFYVYDGRVDTLPCSLQHYVFDDFNFDQDQQVFATTIERFNEVWWFYCSEGSEAPDRYVVFNYAEKVWYHGTMTRTTMLDTNLTSDNPIAATTNNKLVYHEVGVDDLESVNPVAIEAYITSSEFDLEDGDRFGYVRRVFPDLTFEGSTVESPTATLTLLPLKNSGSGYQSPASVSADSSLAVTRTASAPIEEYTEQVNIRVRGRQMSFKISSDGLGVTWQLGHPRIDIRPDGRGA